MKSLTLNRLENYPFEVSESINQLRVNLSFTDKDMKRIVITSAIPNEGKSTISLALWRSLAVIGKKTLLIDCDLRRSQYRTECQMRTEEVFVGIAHVLSGQNDIQDVIYKTNVPNGYMIPVTSLINNPGILLESHRMNELMEQVYDVFDYIIIDTPPMASVADALTVLKNSYASIFVVRSGMAKKELVKESVEKLKRTGKPLLGMVLNGVDTSAHGSYYYKDYGDYYGNYDPDAQKKRKK